MLKHRSRVSYTLFSRVLAFLMAGGLLRDTGNKSHTGNKRPSELAMAALGRSTVITV